MIAMTLAEISAVTDGVVHGDTDLLVTGAAYVDSRQPVPGGLFVAVIGSRTDGHDHAAGAHAVLGSRPTTAPTVVVRDPVVGLARLARHTVAAVRPTVMAITGSHGKTGTKDLLAAALPVAVVTNGNRNNELGVPLTCLRLTVATEQLVLEMGARGLGHLAWLCDIAPPDVAAVLSVGSAHLGEFGSAELIASAKRELVEALTSSGVAVLNVDDPRVAAMGTHTVARVLTYGRAGDVAWRSLRLDALGRPSFELSYAGTSAHVRLALVGAHHVGNAAAAAAMALTVGEPLGAIAERLSAVAPTAHRMELRVRADGLLVVDDSYNANPDAVRTALRVLVDIGRHRGGRTIAVLGEMRELGPGSEQAHREVGAYARELGVGTVLALGSGAAGFTEDNIIESSAHAVTWLQRYARPNDVVLVKGSRAARLDQVVAEMVGCGHSTVLAAPAHSSG
jgi:UDP-N-acetylmuramoyl-tripeptide--D-alanyl-D-alanine ligase